MDSSNGTFTEYLKRLKTRPLKKSKNRELTRQLRVTKRDELRANMRTYSPMPEDNEKNQTRVQPMCSFASSTLVAGSGRKEKNQDERLLRLKLFQEERAKKRIAEKAKAKPVFKVGSYASLPPLNAIQPPLVKGNYQFRAPNNLKTVPFNVTGQKTSTVKVNKVNTTEKPPKVKSVTVTLKREGQPMRRKLKFNEDKEIATITKTNKQSSDKVESVKLEKRVTRQASNANAARKVLFEENSSIVNSKTPKQENMDLANNWEVVDIVSAPKTPKTPKSRKSSKENNDSSLGNVNTLTKTPIKTPKSVKGRKSAGRTPARRLTANELQEMDCVSEDNVQNQHVNIINEVDKSSVDKKGQKCRRSTSTSNDKENVDNNEQPQHNSTSFESKEESSKSSKSNTNKTPVRRRSLRIIDAYNETKEDCNTASTIYPEDLNSTFTIDDTMEAASNEDKTPEKNGDAPVYVSPFVTMSRGKKCARSEYISRTPKGGESVTSPNATGTKAGSVYFYKLLDDETARIRAVCDLWEEYKLKEDPPEEACQMINVPVGQSNLLINKKMKQFRALIDKSVKSDDGLEVTCSDLHGFWDTVMIQVVNIDKRFENLIKLRENNWLEILPGNSEEKATQPTKRVLRKRVAKPDVKVKGVSKIREAIKAARSNKKQNLLPPEVEFNGGFFNIKSPIKEAPIASPRKTPRRSAGRSLLQTVLHSESRKSVVKSPGLAMIKAAQISRRNSVGSKVTNGFGTPTKSILKVATPKSTVKKAVVFKKKEAEILAFEPAPHENLEVDEDFDDGEHIVQRRIDVCVLRRSRRLSSKLSRATQ